MNASIQHSFALLNRLIVSPVRSVATEDDLEKLPICGIGTAGIGTALTGRVGLHSLRKESILLLILGGAAVHRCDKRIVLNTALPAEAAHSTPSREDAVPERNDDIHANLRAWRNFL